MAPELPDRYVLNVRLGRDGDIEEWLATDAELDRPVLIRALGPEASTERSSRFRASVLAAAATSHPHVQKVFAADEMEGAAFSISEWDGAVSVADRLRAGETIPVDEFLPNAAGLAGGLAAYQAAGGVHGAIDTSAIHFSAAHPAKLGGFGRDRGSGTAPDDTRALAAALRTAITGSDNPALLPSQVAEGLPTDVDEALSAGETGSSDAATMAAALSAVPYVPQEEVGTPSHRRGLILFAVIAVVVLVIAAVGLAIGVDRSSDFLYPAGPGGSPQAAVPAPSPEVDDAASAGFVPSAVSVYDPLGDGTEEDDLIANVVDDNPATAWQTERYPAPLSDTKPGVGLVFTPSSSVSTIEIEGTPATRFVVGWAAGRPATITGWQMTGGGTLLAAPASVPLPVREGGTWLLWLTDVPLAEDGSYRAEISAVRFLP